MHRKHLATLLALAVAGTSGSAGAVLVVNADIDAAAVNTTWGDDPGEDEIVLGQPIFVKDGQTLTILPGVIVRGQPRTGPVQAGVIAGSPGALIVTQTGQINAQGEANNPIIFTTAAVDNDQDGIADDVAPADGFDDAWAPGDLFLDADPLDNPLAPLDRAGNENVSKWGGLVINGNAPTNLADLCGVGYGQCTIEGLTIPGFPVTDATYGGVQPHDSSGTLRFVSVRHGGDEIGEGNELNCISLGGVGDGTVIDNVECYANFDDGFEFFGGTADSSRLVALHIGDDSIDLDQGFTGLGQFAFVVMPFFNENNGDSFGSSSGDKAGEWDGDDFGERGGDANIRLRINSATVDPTCWPLQGTDWYNLTVIGSTPDAGQSFVPVSAAGANRGIQMRNGFAGNVANSIIVNTGGAQGYDLDDDIGDGCPGFDSIDNVNAGLIAVKSTTLDDGAALPAAEQIAIANGDAVSPTANVVNNALFAGLVNEDTTFDPQGDSTCPGVDCGKLTAAVAAAKGAPINPRPAFGLVGLGQGVVPSGGILDASATYRGAFERTAPVLWTTGWTVLNRAGLMVD